MSEPGTLRHTVVAVAARWPTLVAWFLAGWLARTLLLRLAGHLANVDPIWGLLVVPLAVLARLVSYVAMFMVVRDALAPPTEDTPLPGVRGPRLRRLGESVLDAILPFFLIYAAWSIIQQDVIDFARSTLDQIDDDTLDAGRGPLAISISVLSVSMVLVAFGLRLLLRFVEDRVPRWTDPISVYLEAVWVLVTVLALRTALSGLPDWLASRRMIAWVLDQVDRVEPLRDALGPAWTLLTDVVLLPLAWLALAAVVFARVLDDGVGRDPHHVGRFRTRLGGLPHRWQRLLALASEGFLERWDPVRRVATIAWRAGPLPIAAYVAAFALVEALRSWLDRGISLLLGPHELGWWGAIASTSGLAVEVVVVPLQLAVVAAALSHVTAAAAIRSRARGAAPAGAAPTR